MQKPYYEKHNFTLYQADSLDLLAQTPENSVDMIFADPHYFLSSGSFTCQNGKMVSVKKGDWDLTNGTKKKNFFPRELTGFPSRRLLDDEYWFLSEIFDKMSSSRVANMP